MKIIWSKYENRTIPELLERCKIKINIDTSYTLLDTYIFPTPNRKYEIKIPPCREYIDVSEEKLRISNFVGNFNNYINTFGYLYLHIITFATDVKDGMKPYIHPDIISRILVEDFMYSNYIKKLL